MATDVHRLPVERKLTIEDFALNVMRDPKQAQERFDLLMTSGKGGYPTSVAIYYLLGMLRACVYIPDVEARNRTVASIMKSIEVDRGTVQQLLADWIGAGRKNGLPPGGAHA